MLVLFSLSFICVAIYGILYYDNARDGAPAVEGTPTAAARPADVVADETARQRLARSGVGRADASQILFGDLHVHTHYSADSHLQAVRIRARESASPPSDACDFARFCSQLDFWSLNDHAESLTPALWTRSVDAIRQCNAVSGDTDDADLVSFLGWEWSHQSPFDPSRHYGHKNVILRDTEPGAIPTRPIASRPGGPLIFIAMGVVAPLTAGGFEPWSSFHRYSLETLDVQECPQDVAVRDLPDDCRESAADPQTLFAKLADWGFPALVIPHGLAWGITNPARADLRFQLAQHDPRWQSLLEVYSGHGNSEVYRAFERESETTSGDWSCPEGGEGVVLCCERAAELTRERCRDPESAECDAQVADAQQRAAGTFFGSPVDAVPGTRIEDWGACGQIEGTFLPAFDYRPRQSAQYAFALGSTDAQQTDARFRWGMIGASDNHRSRPGTGYREFARELMTDGVGYPIPRDWVDERNLSFYYTGGLAAVHATARNRSAIFDALAARRVYGTSGERILLWFDVIGADGSRHPMGSEVVLRANPRFEVRAVGAFEQQPGCPLHVYYALPAERIASLCRGECYNPTAERKPITRIEVVRIRPQRSAEEAIRPLIEDPWRVLECPGDPSGCVAQFSDEDFVDAARETVYYVRAIQAPSPAVNGDPIQCERDDAGRCIRARPCGTLASGLPDDCLAPVEERAWSSPIFADVDPALLEARAAAP
jgi:hypothetical protein